MFNKPIHVCTLFQNINSDTLGYEFSSPLFALSYDEIYTLCTTDAQEVAGGMMVESIQLAVRTVLSCVIWYYCCVKLIYDCHHIMSANLMNVQ